MEISEIFVGLTELTPTTLSILGALVLFAILFFILGPKAEVYNKGHCLWRPMCSNSIRSVLYSSIPLASRRFHNIS